jgi:hypothetical protein
VPITRSLNGIRLTYIWSPVFANNSTVCLTYTATLLGLIEGARKIRGFAQNNQI